MSSYQLIRGILQLKRGNFEEILTYKDEAITLVGLDEPIFIGGNDKAKKVLKRGNITGLHLYDITEESFHAEQDRSFHLLRTYGSADPRTKQNYTENNELITLTVYSKVIRTAKGDIVLARLVPEPKPKKLNKLIDSTSRIITKKSNNCFDSIPNIIGTNSYT